MATACATVAVCEFPALAVTTSAVGAEVPESPPPEQLAVNTTNATAPRVLRRPSADPSAVPTGVVIDHSASNEDRRL
jgi:hypothetical protein